MTQAALDAATKSNPDQETLQDDLYDTNVGYDEEVGVRLAANLSPDDTRRATILYNLFNGLWGLCIVVGDPGTGKDMFGNYLCFRIKRYFPWKRIVRDERPRILFGPYAGLFNEEVLQEELAKMREISRGVKAPQISRVLDKAADDWISSKGEVLLKNSVLYLTEFWKYCSRREPNAPMNKTMGGIHKQKRHIDSLILGTTQMVSDLDRKTCLPWVDWRVTCTRSSINKTKFTYFIEKVKYDKRLDILVATSRPFSISVDAGKPRSYIGDGKITLSCSPRCANWRACNMKIYPPEGGNIRCGLQYDWYYPETEEERIVLDLLRAGVDTYEELVDILETQGDMSEWEILETIKVLKFRKTKRVIDYPCDFSIYNSKSSPNMQSSVRINE